MISRGFSAQHDSPSHRPEFVQSHNPKHQTPNQVALTTRRYNEQTRPRPPDPAMSSTPLSMNEQAAYGQEPENDSINLPWSVVVLNNASAAIGQRHATVPELADRSGSSGWTTNVELTRGISRDNSNENGVDDGPSSKVIESIEEDAEEDEERAIASVAVMRWHDDDSNRDNGVAFGSSNDPPSVLVAFGDRAKAENEEAAAAILRLKWMDESGASTARSLSASGAAVAATTTSRLRGVHKDAKNNSRAEAALETRELADSLIGLGRGLLRTSAALTSDSDTVEGGNRNAITRDTGNPSRSEVGRTNNGTNAKVLAKSNDKSLISNDMNRDSTSSSTTTATTTTKTTVIVTTSAAGLISQGKSGGGGGGAEVGSPLTTTAPSSSVARVVTAATPQHHKSVLLVGVSGGRNKSSAGSIRALNHISDRKPYFGKHHHNNDK